MATVRPHYMLEIHAIPLHDSSKKLIGYIGLTIDQHYIRDLVRQIVQKKKLIGCYKEDASERSLPIKLSKDNESMDFE